MKLPIYVVYDDPANAMFAARALRDSELELDHAPTIVRSVGQGRILYRDSRARAGAALGGIVTGVLVAIIMAVAAAAGGIALPVYLATLIGLLAGGAYGVLLGALAGSTEPSPRMRRLRSYLSGNGRAAVAATVESPADAERAREILLRSPGATGAV